MGPLKPKLSEDVWSHLKCSGYHKKDLLPLIETQMFPDPVDRNALFQNEH